MSIFDGALASNFRAKQQKEADSVWELEESYVEDFKRDLGLGLRPSGDRSLSFQAKWQHYRIL